MTRALFDTDVDNSKRTISTDPDGTVDVETHQMTEVTDSALSRAAKSEPQPGSVSAWSSSGIRTDQATGGLSRRGVVGKIEPDQTLYAKYRVLKKLGGGAMGDVWLVRHVTLKSEHALKVIVPNFAKSSVALMRFQREFEVMATLRHEHAVTIYDAIIDEDGGYIDMEYVEGKTIHDVLNAAKNRPDHDPADPLMPLDWIVRVLDQLCDVLEVAHKKGIVHRDLKPANMMLLSGRKAGKEYLKVLDFGIAKIRDDPDGASGREQEENSNKTEGFIGTPSYGSPEQAMAREDVDGRADLYSVGIMLYEFITGKLPFRGSPLQVMSQNANAPPPPFTDTNPKLRPIPEIEQVVFKILAKERDQRPQTARELFDEFRAAVEIVLPPGSLGSIPSTRDDFHDHSHPSNVDATILPTEHEGQLSRGMISTLQATLISDPSRHDVGKPPRGESPSDLGQVIVEPPTRSNLWLYVTIGLVACGILAIGLVVFSLGPRPPVDPKTKSGEINPPVEAAFEDYWNRDFAVMKGHEEGLPWPERVRRDTDQQVFKRIAKGIYIPQDYIVEDPTDLATDGWPRVISRRDIRFIRIPEGPEWIMGYQDAAANENRSDVPAHPVVLSGFYMQETETTNGQVEIYFKNEGIPRADKWEATFNDLKQNGVELARKHPAVNLSRDQALKFAKYMGAQLPTEAQWEYAARSGGQKRRFVWGDQAESVGSLANVDNQISTTPVHMYKADKTDQGIFDMTGNVQEICRDVSEVYKVIKPAPHDPWVKGDQSDPSKVEYVVRGGYYLTPSKDCGVTRRDEKIKADTESEIVGFRLVVECPDTRKPKYK